MIKKVILGISTFQLTEEEKELLKEYQPYGIILFKRNCQDPNQLQQLTRSIKMIIPDCKIYIDQEGGRVARLRQPEFIEFPAANSFKNAVDFYNNYKKMGEYLYSLGIDANCAPVADLFYPFADNIIGDRSFGVDVKQVVKYAKAAAEGLLDAGIMPVIKHIPGHGRALVDSHLELPIIETELAILEETDFKVFRDLNNLPLAMTAHVVYTALDPEFPVSISKQAIEYIRNIIGFKGLIMSDDINMKALKGNLGDLTTQAFEAGCDIVLHCSGNLAEMKEVLAHC